jgi:hypothetical protein
MLLRIQDCFNRLIRKIVRHVAMLEGVSVAESKAQKDELILTGNDIDMVSQSGRSLKCKHTHQVADLNSHHSRLDSRRMQSTE